MLRLRLPAVALAVMLVAAPAVLAGIDGDWALVGNAGTVSSNFLGTTDATALTIRVNNQSALRLEPAATPRLLGGHGANTGTGFGATIAGGGTSLMPNAVAGDFGFIGGGRGNTATTHGVVGGGFDNDATGSSANIAGGASNRASGQRATVAGGFNNSAAAFLATVGGGKDNNATGDFATIGAGRGNTASANSAWVGGGFLNKASGSFSAVGGGSDNIASGQRATVPGGQLNVAGGAFSFAAGRMAEADHDGTFVWADDAGTPFESTATDQFLIRAAGGVGINTNAPTEALTVAGNISSSGDVTAESFNGDGSGLTGTVPGRPGFSLSAVDTAETSGLIPPATSVTIGVDGLGLISHAEHVAPYGLKVTHCDNIACTSATTSTIDGSGLVQRQSKTSIAIGADGLGLVAYLRGGSSLNLTVAHCNDVLCTSATISIFDDYGEFPSIAIGADGLALISYYAPDSGTLNVAHCNDLACTSATISSLAAAGICCPEASITIGADGLGLIAYVHFDDTDLKIAHCNNINCTSATTSTISSFPGNDLSITVGTDGLGIISYYDSWVSALKVAHCSNIACTSATFSTLDDGTVNSAGGIILGSDGLGLISYTTFTTSYELKVAHCSNTACTNATNNTIDRSDALDRESSITIGTDGFGLISYMKSSESVVVLEVAHLSNIFGVPYKRGR